MNNSESNPSILHRKGNRASGEAIPGTRDSGRESRGYGSRHRVDRPGRLAMAGLAIVLGGAILPGRSGKSSGDADESAAPKVVAPAVVQVSIRNLQFSPPTIEVSKGDVIEWKNEDIVPHTATSASFDSGSILSGQSWRHTFADVGNVPYACTFHPQMKGVVVIR